MPKCFEKILKYSSGEKSLTTPFAIYLDLECLLKKEKNLAETIISKNRIQRKKARHEPSGWAVLIRYSFDEEENKPDYYKLRIDKLCKNLKERAIEIINYEEKNK